MSTRRRYVIGQECRKLIEDATERNLPVMVTNQMDNNWEVYKGNMLAVNSGRLLISQPVSDSGLGHMEAVHGQEVAITFKKGYNKCLFMTRIIGMEQHELEPGAAVQALVVYCPEQLEKVQRRAYNRVEPPAGMDVKVKFWHVQNGDHRHAVVGYLSNLSAGGMGLVSDEEPSVELVENEIYEVQFSPLPEQGTIALKARLRHVGQRADGQEGVLIGLQFIGLEMSEEGRRILRRLGRVVSVYQRQQPLSEHPNLHRQR